MIETAHFFITIGEFQLFLTRKGTGEKILLSFQELEELMQAGSEDLQSYLELTKKVHEAQYQALTYELNKFFWEHVDQEGTFEDLFAALYQQFKYAQRATLDRWYGKQDSFHSQFWEEFLAWFPLASLEQKFLFARRKQ